MNKEKSVRKLILIDLDKTLIDRNYKTTLPEAHLATFFTEVQGVGVTIGISSDSAIGTIEDFARRCSIRGPIIAENGSLVSTLAKPGIFEKNMPGKNFFPKLRGVLSEKLHDKTTVVIIGNANPLAVLLKGSNYNLGVVDTIILINGYRQASISFFVIKKTRGVWKSTNGSMEKVLEAVKEIAIANLGIYYDECCFDINPEYGICIIRKKGMQKSSAIPRIKRKYPGYRIFVIGDSMGDFYDVEGITHCAVSNASREFKKRCQLVAKKPYSKGVVELIGEIVKQ